MAREPDDRHREVEPHTHYERQHKALGRRHLKAVRVRAERHHARIDPEVLPAYRRWFTEPW